MNKLTSLIAVAILSLFAVGCSETYLTQVDRTQVCMSNNFDMEAKQTPVVLDGKTYYVCCEGCKNTLTEHKKERLYIDPVSGVEIDRSEAVIGRKENGEILYFENLENMKKWKPEPKKEEKAGS